MAACLEWTGHQPDTVIGVEPVRARPLTAGKVAANVVMAGCRPPHYPVVLRHLIDHPTEILFDLIPQGAALKITSASGTTTLVSLLRRSGHGDAQGA